jgi:acylphosphatase
MMRDSKIGRQLTVKGIVTPSDWDDDGNVTAVVVSTPSEEEYLVERSDLTEELLGLLGAELVVTGTIGPEKRGIKTIAVRRYELLEEDEEEEELEEEEEFYEEKEFSDEEFPEEEEELEEEEEEKEW